MPIWDGVPVIGAILSEVKHRDIGCYVTDYFKFEGNLVNGFYNDYGGINDKDGNEILSDREETGSISSDDWKREWNDIWMCRKDIFDEMSNEKLELFTKEGIREISISDYMSERIEKIKSIDYDTEGDPLATVRNWQAIEEAVRYSEGGMGYPLSIIRKKLYDQEEITDDEIKSYRTAHSICMILRSVCKPLSLQGNMGSQDEMVHKSAFDRMHAAVSRIFDDRESNFDNI